MRFKGDWASLIVGSKFAVFALFYFVFEGNFPNTSPRGAYIWRGDLTEGFLRYRIWGLIFGGAYTSRGLFSEFYGITTLDLEAEFFREARTPALNDYASRRFFLYRSAKPLHTEKAGSKGTGMASKVARQE